MSHNPEKMLLPNSMDRRTVSVVKGLLQNEEDKRLGRDDICFPLLFSRY